MVRDMLRSGYDRPVIEEVAGPMVRTVLVGGEPDVAWIRFLDQLRPRAASSDVDSLLLLDHFARVGWADARSAAPVLQKSVLEAEHALVRLDQLAVLDKPVVAMVVGTAANPARRLSYEIRRELSSRLVAWLPPAGRPHLVRGWARHRGRVSTTEIADIVSISVNASGELLKTLAEQGLLAPGRAARTGRGFFYVPTSDGETAL